MTLGDLFAHLAEYAYELWPCRLVYQWEQGIRVSGGHVRALLTYDNGLFGTGLHFFLPFWQEVEKRDANLQVTELDWQTVRLRSGEEVTFSLSAKFRLRDMAALYQKVHSAGESISEAIRSGAGKAARTFETAEQLADGLTEAALTAARAQMRGWGVELIEVNLVNQTLATPVRLIMDPIGGGGDDE